MDIDWAGLLARKYDLMQQNADTQRMGMIASAELDRTRAGLLPAESRAGIGLTNAQAGAATAAARKTNEEASVVRPLADASIFATRAQGRQSNAAAIGDEQINRLSRFRLRGLGDQLGVLDGMVRRGLRFGLLGSE